MEEIISLLKVIEPKKGNRPNFDEAHVLIALDTINKHQPIGRQLLTRMLSLSEASIRTMIRRLRELEFVEVDRVAGIFITDKGKKLLEYLHKRTVILENVMIYSIQWKVNGVVILNGMNILNKIGILDLRDNLIKLGASKILIAVKNDNQIELPPKTFDESEEIKRLKTELVEKFSNIPSNSLIILFEPQDIHLAYKIIFTLLNIHL
ncbi:hypothetical protein SUSAZ_06730 [Sulfolobus acidocaldarius SUSAZ]|nr:hypothetical protein SUSAZ_06730 [Sulfolobus acidocaldarius SUSAZ]